METVTLVVISVIATLGIGSIVYLISSVRSLQNKIKTLNAMLSLREKEDENIYECIDGLDNQCRENLNKELEALIREVDRRFDKNYRTMYEFRDWASDQINRLIEVDAIKKLKKQLNK